MIDWVTANLPLSWDLPIADGHVLSIDAAGEVEYVIPKRALIRGSFDSAFTLRTVERGRVEVSGNPSKFLQGHNLFGVDDLHGLVHATMCKALSTLGRPVSDVDEAAWLAGDYSLSRVDLTYMFELPNRADVRAWLRAAGELASIRWRGRGHFTDGTLTFGRVAKGKRASNWQLVLYCKGDEIERPGHRMPLELPLRDDLAVWADNKLRVELRLRTGELKRLGLRTASSWSDSTASSAFNEYFSKIELGEAVMVPTDCEDSLKPMLRLVYDAWRRGEDVRGLLPRATFYRHRRALLESIGVDISALQPAQNVVPLKRPLEAVPAAIPSWAPAPILWTRTA